MDIAGSGVIEQECQDLEGLLADIYRRMAQDDRSEACAVAALLRFSAVHFERLARADQQRLHHG